MEIIVILLCMIGVVLILVAKEKRATKKYLADETVATIGKIKSITPKSFFTLVEIQRDDGVVYQSVFKGIVPNDFRINSKVRVWWGKYVFSKKGLANEGVTKDLSMIDKMQLI